MRLRLVAAIPQIFGDLARVLWRLGNFRPQVVHLNTSGSLAHLRDLPVLALCAAFRVPVVVHIRYGRIPEVVARAGWESYLASRVVRRASGVIALDSRTADCLRSLGCSSVHQLPNFVTLRAVEPSAESRRREVLYVGWMLESKGLVDLQQAWAKASRDGWTLTLIGPPSDDPLVNRAIKRCRAAVRVVGELTNSEVREAMARCGIFVLPSHSEGFPNVVAEAMAEGAPIVATQVGAIPEMLAGDAGRLVPPRDPERLAEQLTSLIRNPQERARLGANARAKCERWYAQRPVMDKLYIVWRQHARAPRSLLRH